jgi:hypothetical protein
MVVVVRSLRRIAFRRTSAILRATSVDGLVTRAGMTHGASTLRISTVACHRGWPAILPHRPLDDVHGVSVEVAVTFEPGVVAEAGDVDDVASRFCQSGSP